MDTYNLVWRLSWKLRNGMAKVKFLLLCVIVSSTLILSSCFPEDILWRWEIPDPCELHGMEYYDPFLSDVETTWHFPGRNSESFIEKYNYIDSFFHFVGKDYNVFFYDYETSVCELKYEDAVYSEAKQYLYDMWGDNYNLSNAPTYTYKGFSLYKHYNRFSHNETYEVWIMGFDDENKVIVSLNTHVLDDYYKKTGEEFIDWDNGYLTADTLEEFLDFHFGEYYSLGETIHD